jgi:hypothetical protein
VIRLQAGVIGHLEDAVAVADNKLEGGEHLVQHGFRVIVIPG